MLTDQDQARTTLPEDALIEILVRLSVKSLVRFRCVSKPWCDLIKSSSFVAEHLNRDRKESLLVKRHIPSQGNNNVISFHDPDSPDLSELLPNLRLSCLDDTEDPDGYLQLYGPCNGIVCLLFDVYVFFCNPALREFDRLPRSYAVSCPEDYAVVYSGSGFGFDPSTNSYIVVQIWSLESRSGGYYDREEPGVKVELYNSNTNSWRLIDDHVANQLRGVVYVAGFERFLKGAFHWTRWNMGAQVIVSLDIRSTEIVREFDFPSWNDRKFPNLIILNECLAVLRCDGFSGEPDLIDVWVMKEYGVIQSWTKQFVVGPALVGFPFVSWKNEWILFECRDGQLTSCSLTRPNEVKIFGLEGLKSTWGAQIFKESLISLRELINFEPNHDPQY